MAANTYKYATFSLLLFCSIVFASDTNFLWTYDDQLAWTHLSAFCSQSQQSPIDIYSEFCERDPRLKLELQNFHYPYSKGVYYWRNDGHTYKLTKANSNDGKHIVTGSVLNNEPFAFRQLHLHWNRREQTGSEHSIDGERFALEVHYVNEKINRDNHRNQLVVLSSLFKVGRHNSFFDELTESIGRLRHTNDNVTLVERDPSKSIADGLPKDTSRFFAYDGSLTTPGCDENVLWIIFKEIQEISAEQLSAIRLNHPEKANVRSSQKLNHRLIYDVDPNSASASHFIHTNMLIMTTVGMWLVHKFHKIT